MASRGVSSVLRPQYADPKTLRLAPNVRVASVEPDDQEEFEASIAMHGVCTPLGVRLAEDGATEVTFGSRRLAAALKFSLPAVPIHWSDTTDEALRTAQLIENLHRDNGHSLDIAAAVWDMYNNEAGGSQTFISEVLSKPKSWVSKMMKIGADVPDAANTVARGLMLSNNLSDADMGYTLCQIEALSLAEAQRIGKEISAYVRASAKAALPDATDGDRDTLSKCILHTRGTLRTALKHLQLAVDGTPSPEPAAAGNVGETGDADPGEPSESPQAAAHSPDREDYEMLAHILADAAVPTKWLARLTAMRTFVATKLASGGV